MAKVVDPVCGMELDTSQAQAHAIHHGQAFYFCSENCRRQFEEDPSQFSDAAGVGTTDDELVVPSDEELDRW